MPASRTSPESSQSSPITRRRFVGAAAGAIVAPMLISNVAAQEEFKTTPQSGTPMASPVTSIDIDIDALYNLSKTLVGGGELNQKAVEPLAKLIGADENLASGFEELAKIDDPTTDDAMRSMSDNASATIKNILLYWFDGYFGNQPVEDRADILFSLPVWSTVPYSAQPTVCKAFGYWANEVSIDNQAT